MEQAFLFDDAPHVPQTLSERFGENPFSVLRADSNRWQDAERGWKSLGIKSELGRTAKAFNIGNWDSLGGNPISNQSIFSAHLTELMYAWYCPISGSILDPFTGGSVRGIVAGALGCDYTGIDIRPEQVEEDQRQAEALKKYLVKTPTYIVGDSRSVLDGMDGEYDLVFSCPPYADLERYSDLAGDVSNMDYDEFLVAYADIIHKACAHVKQGGFAVWVVAEIRDRRGNLRGFVPDTIRAFQQAGMNYYNELVLCNAIGSARLRTAQFTKSRKVVKTHQNILVFCKGTPTMQGFRQY